MNPPYGRQIGKWVGRARVYGRVQFIKRFTTIVCLLPARTDTRWWHDNIPYASHVTFIKGRLTFGSESYWQWRWETELIDGKPNSLFGKHGKKNSAPFPSAFVVFGPLERKQRGKLSSYGWSV